MKGLVTIGIVLVIAWVFGFLVFKTASFLIHLLLIVGAIMLVIGLVKRASGSVSTTR
jgi:hypothetical protein